jgi:hypothetical protein
VYGHGWRESIPVQSVVAASTGKVRAALSGMKGSAWGTDPVRWLQWPMQAMVSLKVVASHQLQHVLALQDSLLRWLHCRSRSYEAYFILANFVHSPLRDSFGSCSLEPEV